MLRLPHGREAASQHGLEAGGMETAARFYICHVEAGDNCAEPGRDTGGRDEYPKMGRNQKTRRRTGLKLCRLYGSLEMDIAELTDEEAAGTLIAGLDITEPGRERLIEEAYKVLGLISFFTCGPDEVRAWTLHNGENASSMLQALFTRISLAAICAQVVAFDVMPLTAILFGRECCKAGCLRLEGKEYIVKDGDMIEIRFNV